MINPFRPKLTHPIRQRVDTPTAPELIALVADHFDVPQGVAADLMASYVDQFANFEEIAE